MCVVGELKVSNKKKEDLNKLAENQALTQAEKNEYGKKYEEMGYKLIKLGIAFKGNKFGFAYKVSEKKTLNFINKGGGSKRFYSTMSPRLQYQQLPVQKTLLFDFNKVEYFDYRTVMKPKLNFKRLSNLLIKLPRMML